MFELVAKEVNMKFLQVWRIAAAPVNDKFQYTHFAHKINSFETAPRKLLASDSRLRSDRYALEKGDLSKAGVEKSRCLSLSLFPCLCVHVGQLHAHMSTSHAYHPSYLFYHN